MDTDTVIIIARSVFNDMSPANFCGCREGDLNGAYSFGTELFLDRLRVMLDNRPQKRGLPGDYGDDGVDMVW